MRKYLQYISLPFSHQMWRVKVSSLLIEEILSLYKTAVKRTRANYILQYSWHQLTPFLCLCCYSHSWVTHCVTLRNQMWCKDEWKWVASDCKKGFEFHAHSWSGSRYITVAVVLVFYCWMGSPEDTILAAVKVYDWVSEKIYIKCSICTIIEIPHCVTSFARSRPCLLSIDNIECFLLHIQVGTCKIRNKSRSRPNAPLSLLSHRTE